MTTRHFIWDPATATLLMEATPPATPLAYYTWEPNGLISRFSSALRVYHFDALSSTRALTDESELITDTYIYDAFGMTIASVDPSANVFRYLGDSGVILLPDHILYVIDISFFNAATATPASAPDDGFATAMLKASDETCFPAGGDTDDPHEVCFTKWEAVRCKLALVAAVTGASALDLMPCTRSLLKNYLQKNFGGTTASRYCSSACRSVLRNSEWLKAHLKEQTAFPNDCKSQDAHRCGAHQDVHAFRKGFVSTGEIIDHDGHGAFGKIDFAALCVTATKVCNAPEPVIRHGESCICCQCNVTGNWKLTVRDKYDFISTLPSTPGDLGSPVWYLFRCAAILEYLKVGTVFTTACELTGRDVRSFEECIGPVIV